MDEMDDEDSEANLVLALAVEPEDLTLEELFGLSDEQIVEVVVRTLARVQVEEPVEISVLVTNDENLRTLNREYRELDNSTDVLSFPAQDEPLVSAPADELWQHADDEEFEDEEYTGGANGASPNAASVASAQNPAMALDADERTRSRSTTSSTSRTRPLRISTWISTSWRSPRWIWATSPSRTRR